MTQTPPFSSSSAGEYERHVDSRKEVMGSSPPGRRIGKVEVWAYLANHVNAEPARATSLRRLTEFLLSNFPPTFTPRDATLPLRQVYSPPGTLINVGKDCSTRLVEVDSATLKEANRPWTCTASTWRTVDLVTISNALESAPREDLGKSRLLSDAIDPDQEEGG